MSAFADGNQNPFYHRSPIRNPAHFFGRIQELRQLGTLLANGQSISLIGPRRIGKSSLFHQLSQPAIQTANGCAMDNRRVVYFDAEGWQDQPAQVLYAALWTAIVDASTAAIGTDPLSAEVPENTVEMLDFPTFQRALRRLNHTEHRLILLVDEFDTLSRNRNLDEVFFSSLRSLAATHGVAFVTASTVPLLQLTYAQQSALSSPFFNIFLPQRLGLLTNDEAHALVQGTAALSGYQLTERQSAELVNLAGPHPLFLQIAGYHWWEAHQQARQSDPSKVSAAFFEEVEPHWRYQWRYLPIEEQRALALLQTEEPQPAALVAQLQHQGLIRRTAGQSTYLSEGFRGFVRQQTIHQLIQAEDLLLDQQRQQAWLRGKTLALSPQDYRLLEALATQAGETVTHTALAAMLWPDEQVAINQQSRLKVAVRSLRQKLGEQSSMLTTDPAGGYRLT